MINQFFRAGGGDTADFLGNSFYSLPFILRSLRLPTDAPPILPCASDFSPKSPARGGKVLCVFSTKKIMNFDSFWLWKTKRISIL